ncbi:F-box protein [Phanerochaete sordida]|uniref:F-box protein n=1 Tax=Phanerochaete sordida TaxID=48140 RepID=A0A9P3L7E3_9APHY|nr:F-box protein [Phanerochaete sordida]
MESFTNIPLDLVKEFLYHLQPVDVLQRGWPDTVLMKKDLAACTLVSRTWRALAQPYLFRDIFYSFMEDASDPAHRQVGRADGRWIGSTSYSQWLPQKTFSMLLDFLRQSPDLACYIRRLVLSSVVRGIVPTAAAIEAGAVAFADFTELLQLLPYLSDLGVREFKLSIPAQLQLPIPPVPSLAELDMDNNTTRLSPATAAAILACFSTVDTLRLMCRLSLMDSPLNSYGSPPEPEPVGLVPASRTQVNYVLFGAANSQTYMETLKRFVQFEGIRALDIMPTPRLWLHQDLIDACSPSLEELSVFVSMDDNPYEQIPKPMPVPSITACHNLRQLIITTSACPDEDFTAFPNHSQDQRTHKEKLQEQLEPVTHFLARANIHRDAFPHLTALGFLLDVGLHGFAGGVKTARLSDVRCEGAADELDEILYGIARELPGKKVTFSWIDMSFDHLPEYPGENGTFDGDFGLQQGEEFGARASGETTAEKVVGGEVFLGRLFPRLNEHEMIEVTGVAQTIPGQI